MQGLLLVNLGTPAAPTAKAVRRYLKQFLGDPRVIQTPQWLWQPLLRGVILPVRGPKSAKMYQRIWTEQGSPLQLITEQQTAAVAALRPDLTVRYAMSYSEPTIESVLAEMSGLDELTIVPLYPQYSTTTVASVLDSVHRFYLKQTTTPKLHLINGFCQLPAYQSALTNNVAKQLAGESVDAVVFSYHGIPQSYADQGDPYASQCQLTTDAVVRLAGLDVPVYQTYQSKFGPAAWLTPATIDTLPKLAQAGKRRIAVVTPSFVADCLETIDEIDRENRNAFMAAGGEHFVSVRPLNADPAFMRVLAGMVPKG